MTEIKLSEIKKARDKCARIVAKYGIRYLPIFERLEKEIAIREAQEKLFQKALEISTQIDTQIGTQNDHHDL
ncbi:MAG: hypothetical protein JNK00_00345 [Flavipsychrobacter sp.]|nr:hypothetical protein [Flavipsychrobacter sp.]